MSTMVEQVEDKVSISKRALLNDEWTLWAHLPHDTNWNLDSYKKISDINSVESALMLFENLPEVMIKNCMLFLMRKGIQPIWEDPKNRNGGCFSYKINNKIVPNCWKSLSYILLGETLTNEKISNIVTGITISPKKNFCIIKIWLSNCDNNDPSIIADIEGLARHGCLFKKHISSEL
tara:strand:+ start:661 stop:1191 length:531 start_codon:yes stop_codon:yes gene_type:complete